MPPWHLLALLLLGTGYALALSQGSLTWPAAPVFLLLILLALAVRYPRLRGLGHGVFIMVGLALAFHMLPGFKNALVIDRVTLSHGAAPFSMALNLDKPLIGIWLLSACPWVVAGRGLSTTLRVGLLAIGATALLLFGLAQGLQAVAWAPKWPAQGWLWAANNLLLVSLTEELLFRGYVQACLQRRWRQYRHGAAAALLVSAALFGLTHLGGGGPWLLLATLAGVAYGLAWRYGGLGAAVLCHFGVNLIHFTLFSYPLKL